MKKTLIILLGLLSLWTYKGITEVGIHADLARDLNYLSDLWVHKMVWLGPATSANFPASPIYYYLLFPGLLLSGGNGLSLIISHTFLAFLALAFFAYFQLKKSFVSTILVILTIGLSPWWINSISLPWNGHMYVLWVFLGLSSLWFKNPIFISSLLFGISVAIDPAAVLALPVLFYEWLSNKKRVKNLIYLTLGLLIPWSPILIFELITKGFLTREWLLHPSAAGLTFSQKSTNITFLLNNMLVSQGMAVAVWIATFLIGSKREKWWLIFISLPLIFLGLSSSLRQYYLLGLMCALTFIIVVSWAPKTIGKAVMIVLIITYAQMVHLNPISFTSRSIPRLDNIVATFIQNTKLDKTKKYAVVSVIDRKNSTPQADDYRFFLRTKGVNTLSIDQYKQADFLLLFIEVLNFNYQNFDDWHMQQFGRRKFISSQNIDGIEIIIYGR